MDKLGGIIFFFQIQKERITVMAEEKKECVSATHSLKYRAKNFPALLGIETLLF